MPQVIDVSRMPKDSLSRECKIGTVYSGWEGIEGNTAEIPEPHLLPDYETRVKVPVRKIKR